MSEGSQGLAIASMVVGILSILIICWQPAVGIIAAIVAIVLGIVHNVKNGSSGMAIAGIVCGSVALVLFVILLILFVAGIALLGGALYSGL